MALAIRLARGGAKKRPFYRIVVADSRSPRDGRFIEKLGTYNPLLQKDDENRVTMKLERIQYWLGQGARPSDRVSRFLESAGVFEKKTRDNPKKAKPGKKALERLEARKEAEEAAKQAAEEAAAAEAKAPAEDSQAEAAADDGQGEQAQAKAEEAAPAKDEPAEEAAAEPEAKAEEPEKADAKAEETAPAEAGGEEADNKADEEGKSKD